MVNILIKETDVLFSYGLKYFLKSLFSQNFNEDIYFINEYTPDNISIADIIILSLRPGERYTCFPELRLRRRGVIIGIVNEAESAERSPTCFADIVYVSRRSSLAEMNTTISLLWRDWLASPHFMQFTDCLSCKCRQMSTKQFQIVTQYYEGKSVNEIAIDMGLNYKTVFRHKYQVMNKYNLHSDIELLTFLNVLAQKTT